MTIFRVILYISLISISACKKGLPNLSELRSIDGFSLDKNLITVSSKSNPSFEITGKCSSQFTKIQISLDSGDSWIDSESIVSSANINCSSNGEFKLEFKNDISSRLSTTTAKSTGEWKFRGIADLGASENQVLNLVEAAKKDFQIILSGANTTISNGYKLVSRVGGMPKDTNNGYTLKSRVKEN